MHFEKDLQTLKETDQMKFIKSTEDSNNHYIMNL